MHIYKYTYLFMYTYILTCTQHRKWRQDKVECRDQNNVNGEHSCITDFLALLGILTEISICASLECPLWLSDCDWSTLTVTVVYKRLGEEDLKDLKVWPRCSHHMLCANRTWWKCVSESGQVRNHPYLLSSTYSQLYNSRLGGDCHLRPYGYGTAIPKSSSGVCYHLYSPPACCACTIGLVLRVAHRIPIISLPSILAYSLDACQRRTAISVIWHPVNWCVFPAHLNLVRHILFIHTLQPFRPLLTNYYSLIEFVLFSKSQNAALLIQIRTLMQRKFLSISITLLSFWKFCKGCPEATEDIYYYIEKLYHKFLVAVLSSRYSHGMISLEQSTYSLK